MKKILLCFFILLLVISVKAQEWAPIGAKWCYEQFGNIAGGPCDGGYSTMEAIADTQFLGKEAKVFQIRSFENDYMPERKEILYEENGKIYHYLDSSFYVLYDFNLKKGDTLTIKTDTVIDYYNGGVYSNFIVVIDSVDSIQIGDKYFKRWHTYEQSPSFSEWTFHGPIIENIGDLQLFFGFTVAFPAAGCWGGLICYSDSIFTYVSWDNYQELCNECLNPSGFIDAKDGIQKKIKIYPNPVTDISYLHLPKNNAQFVSMEIYNILGKQIQYKEHLSGNYIYLYQQDFKPGIYSYRLIIKQNAYYTGSFIVH